MDAKSFNGEPGAMPYDRDHGDLRGHEPEVTRRTCRDCGTAGTDGFTGTPYGTYCAACHLRRGLAHIFDPRTWSQIVAARTGHAA